MIAREDALEALQAERFDLVVIGGGITGAGVALDAASRGYSVCLVERDDYAAGTSSRSSKLVHGGLRYLQNFDLGLVREALLERALMVNLAPHLVHPLAFLVPGVDGKHPDRAIGVGLNMYDVMARERMRKRDGEDWSPDRHRVISAEETLELAPALAARNPISAYLFYDCQTDDVRLVLTVLGEAERFGAVLANRCEVTGLIERGGRAAGVLCRDRVSEGEFEIAAENVVSATGVWADRIRPDELYGEEEVPHIRPSRGTHVIVAHEKLPLDAGVIVPGGRGRTVFALPWLGRTLIGTTDNDYEGSLDHVPPVRAGRRLPARRGATPSSTARPRPADLARRLRRRTAADLHGGPEEVGGHLAQGRAVRDQLGPAHDHRRQAHHLAADGQAHRGPDRRARGAARRPAARTRSRSASRRARATCPRSTAWTRTAAGCSPAATATPRARCWSWRPRGRG